MKDRDRNLESAIANGALSFAIVLGAPSIVDSFYPGPSKEDTQIEGVARIFNETPPITIKPGDPTFAEPQPVPTLVEAGSLPQGYPQVDQEKAQLGKPSSPWHSIIAVEKYPQQATIPANGCTVFEFDQRPPKPTEAQAVAVNGPVTVKITGRKFIFCAGDEGQKTPRTILVWGKKKLNHFRLNIRFSVVRSIITFVGLP